MKTFSRALRIWLTAASLVLAKSPSVSAAESASRLIQWGDTRYGSAILPPDLGDVVQIASRNGLTVALRRDGTVRAWGFDDQGKPPTVPEGLNGVSAVAVGYGHIVALRTNGTVIAWGLNNYGQADVPADLHGVKAITAGHYFTAALRQDGIVERWGSESRGTPELIEMPTAVAISAGAFHLLILRSDGTVVVRGLNPDAHGYPSEAIRQRFKAIAAGDRFSIALAEDGTVSAWGDSQGTVPPGLKSVTAIASGATHSLALLENGTVVAWGGGNELGETSVPNYLRKVTHIAAGSYRSFALGEILVHRATATVAFDNGSVRSGKVVDGGYGYTNAPKVRIEGGGGTGAKALAVVEDGVVTSIQITAEGAGYETQPTIRIASPNAPPGLAIRVATVFVDLDLIFGNTYQLHSSKDLIHWTPLGDPFTAEDEHITKEFTTTETGQYFRAEQLP